MSQCSCHAFPCKGLAAKRSLVEANRRRGTIDARRKAYLFAPIGGYKPSGGIRQRLMADFREGPGTVAIGFTRNFGKTRSNCHLSSGVGG